MELVQGVPITSYCDGNRLSTRERLDLFADVCRAIHHAHEKGIIHRDIKPSNVMVTLHDGTPVPKIIDFGVAKATNQRLTEKTLFTAYGQFVGTPAYMSPEQAEMSGLEIDRRSDIYSLGVLLYELLTGTTPFDAETLRTRGFLEIMRVIREEDPPTPSGRLSTLGDRLIEVAGRRQVEPHALQRLIRGDLDWIVMKAIGKDRRQRYGSASELADDIVRHARHEPVTARRPSAGYRLRKFARRNRAALVAAVSVVGVILMGGALAQVAGVFTSATSGPATPGRRLVADFGQMGIINTYPTHDGRQLVRFDRERRSFELTDFATGRTTQLARAQHLLAQSTRRDLNFSLSPDGKLIAAVHEIGSNPNAQPRDTVAELRLYQVGSEGDGRLLTRWEQGAFSYIQIFAWSPDRAKVWVFVLRPDRAAEVTAVAVADGTRHVLHTIAQRSHTQAPSLSPDGRFLAYHDGDSLQSPPDIFLIGTDGAAPVRVEHPATDTKPLFTPDGSGVVFQSDRKGGDLWFLPVANGRPAGDARPVWGDLGPYGTAVSFGQNGSLTYFFRTNGWEIFTAPIDLERGIAGTPEHLPPVRGEMNTAPTFSVDGQFLGHLRNQGRRLVLRHLTSGAEREFSVGGSLQRAGLDFCPDGRSAIVAGFEKDESVVYRVNLERGGAERFEVPAGFAVCLAEGREIVYLRPLGQTTLYQVIRRSLVTGAENPLHGGPVLQVALARSPDAGKIAFVELGDDEARLVVMPSTGGKSQTVASSPVQRFAGRVVPNFQGFVWLRAGNGLLVSQATGVNAETGVSEVTLSRVLLDGSPAKAMVRMRLPVYDGGFIGSLNYSLHPNGSRIAFERHTGMLAQFWAIDNLAQFIESGAPPAATPGPNRR
jgi:dipeptidyl aminopeptidase/acylaminoacyl peptidase